MVRQASMTKNKSILIWQNILLLIYPLMLTWPLATRALTDIPLGSEGAVTVPLFNLWTLGWNIKQIFTGFQGYWDAPIFWPALGAFAYSDTQLLAGWLAAPWWRLSPALAYNFVLLSI